jgi:hypothetical protein
MRKHVLIAALLLAASPSALRAQEGPRRGAPVPARAVQEASAARRAFVRPPSTAQAARSAAAAVRALPPKRRVTQAP